MKEDSLSIITLDIIWALTRLSFFFLAYACMADFISPLIWGGEYRSETPPDYRTHFIFLPFLSLLMLAFVRKCSSVKREYSTLKNIVSFTVLYFFIAFCFLTEFPRLLLSVVTGAILAYSMIPERVKKPVAGIIVLLSVPYMGFTCYWQFVIQGIILPVILYGVTM